MDNREIDKAIGAHGMWKMRLKMAISSGTSDTPVETIAKDTECAFGKWLYGPSFNAGTKTDEHYIRVKELHAQFHRCAARVAELAQAGNQAEAQQMMEADGAFSVTSQQLTQAMSAWKKQIA